MTYSKFEALFNLEQIKERNKVKLAKEDLPQLPFFLFDLDKATALDSGETGARDFLEETFYSSFKAKRDAAQNKAVGGKALAKHGQVAGLSSLLREKPQEVLSYLKTLSPSGIELEIMSLTTFTFNAPEENMVFLFLDLLSKCIDAFKDSNFCQALLNCTLKTHCDAIVEDEALVEKV